LCPRRWRRRTARLAGPATPRREARSGRAPALGRRRACADSGAGCGCRTGAWRAYRRGLGRWVLRGGPWRAAGTAGDGAAVDRRGACLCGPARACWRLPARGVKCCAEWKQLGVGRCGAPVGPGGQSRTRTPWWDVGPDPSCKGQLSQSCHFCILSSIFFCRSISPLQLPRNACFHLRMHAARFFRFRFYIFGCWKLAPHKSLHPFAEFARALLKQSSQHGIRNISFCFRFGTF
jgi:hypothetical protein